MKRALLVLLTSSLAFAEPPADAPLAEPELCFPESVVVKSAKRTLNAEGQVDYLLKNTVPVGIVVAVSLGAAVVTGVVVGLIVGATKK